MLAEQTGNVFATWEWASEWWKHFGAGKELLLLRFEAPSGEAVGIVPLAVRKHGPLRLGRFVGHGPSDQVGPVCAPDDREAILLALGAHLEADLVVDVLVGDQVLEADGWEPLLGAAALRRDSSPLLTLDGSWEGWLDSKSSNFRQQVRRKTRHLVEDHGLRFRLTADPGRLDSDLSELVRLHRARWGAASTALTGPRQAFHRSFARIALELGWLRLWIAEVEGVKEPVAAWYGFRYGAAESFYQSGRDPRWEDESIGFVVLCHTIQAAFDDGMREYRLLRGGDQYKRRFADSAPELLTAVIGHGRRGRAAATAGRRLSASRRGTAVLARIVG